MDEEREDLLIKNHEKLIDVISGSIDKVCESLYAKKTISKGTREDILENLQVPTNSRRASKLLILITTQGERAFDDLYDSLKENEIFEASEILEPETTESRNSRKRNPEESVSEDIGGLLTGTSIASGVDCTDFGFVGNLISTVNHPAAGYKVTSVTSDTKTVTVPSRIRSEGCEDIKSDATPITDEEKINRLQDSKTHFAPQSSKADSVECGDIVTDATPTTPTPTTAGVALQSSKADSAECGDIVTDATPTTPTPTTAGELKSTDVHVGARPKQPCSNHWRHSTASNPTEVPPIPNVEQASGDDSCAAAHSRFVKLMPHPLNTDLIDIIIVNSEEDRASARQFRKYLTGIKGLDLSLKIELLDEMYGSSPLTHLDEAIERTVFVFLYVTEVFSKDFPKLLKSHVCLLEMLEDDDRSWSVVLVYTQEKRTYTLPALLRNLTKLEYFVDKQGKLSDELTQHLHGNVKKLVKSKLHIIATREEELQRNRKAHFESRRNELEQKMRSLNLREKMEEL